MMMMSWKRVDVLVQMGLLTLRLLQRLFHQHASPQYPDCLAG